jgi:hypothetical protein
MSVLWFVLGAALLLAGIMLTVWTIAGFIALFVAGGCFAKSFLGATQ